MLECNLSLSMANTSPYRGRTRTQTMAQEAYIAACFHSLRLQRSRSILDQFKKGCPDNATQNDWKIGVKVESFPLTPTNCAQYIYLFILKCKKILTSLPTSQASASQCPVLKNLKQHDQSVCRQPLSASLSWVSSGARNTPHLLGLLLLFTR